MRSVNMFYVRAIVCIMLCFLWFKHTTGLKQYQSCRDVKKVLGTSASDGEYILYLRSKRNLGVSIYCYGMLSSNTSPKEFITLRAGRSSNFAHVYENVGSADVCADVYPRQMYALGGKSEFTKVAINLDSLVLDTGDFTFANHSSANHVRFGSAGDNWTSSDRCIPMGAFQIDFTGTPYTVAMNTVWTWSGSYASGSIAQGRARIDNHTYLGCFPDKIDRVLTAGRLDNRINQTVSSCIRHCKSYSPPYSYAGLEFGLECHCGNDYNRFAGTRVSDDYCNQPCAGNTEIMCGALWYVSIYSTDSPQVYTGQCGGFPGHCFPAMANDPNTQMLTVDIMYGEHVCLSNNPCKNSGLCIALDAEQFRCQCYDGYSGTKCETINTTVIDDGQNCPPGYQGETCLCFERSCNGARFDGDTCISSTGKSQMICRPGDPGHVILFNVDSFGSVACPPGAEIVGCSYWANFAATNLYGQAETISQRCEVTGIANTAVNVQARCKQYVCGCENGGLCNKATGLCDCLPSYYGVKCETFDFCTYYEDTHNHSSPCSTGGICTPVHKSVVKATGGDMAGDTCIFPFDYADITFNSCVQDNSIGPPFACAGEFALSGQFKDFPTYIDVGTWSPGPKYTLAAWVRPDKIDTMRQTIVGGAAECNDFGFNFNSGTFRGYLKLSTECTRDLQAGTKLVDVGKWHMVAITSNATHASIYLNGRFMNMNTVLMNHIPTTAGFWIGSAVCCPADYFRGKIKTVKVWNRELSNDEINRSMYNIGTKNSTVEALHDGLVGHWDLGESTLPACSGGNAVDHGGEDWTLRNGEIISGIHCNISWFLVPKGVSILVAAYDGVTGGSIDITAQEVRIDGYINGVGAGYKGGISSNITGDGGVQGDSYSASGTKSLQENRGGGGGGIGGNGKPDGSGRSGGGGGYGSSGLPGVKVVGDRTGLGSGGQIYGDSTLDILYMGSGGGSGGNAKDLATNPVGGRGGNGGAAVKIVAERSIVITGVISVAGQPGEGDTAMGTGCMGCPDSCDLKSPVQCLGNSTVACWDMSGPGGGGSGGSIYLSAKLVDIGYQKLWAYGGDGGAGGSHCCGGTGGMGRIRVDSIIMKGITGDLHGVLKTMTLKDTFIDYSQTGQKQINYKTTVYGNEVYRGCFVDDVSNRTLSVAVSSTQAVRSQMTPDYCRQLCRQHNFMFSGTENASECYCDNHLDMNRKVADSDCSTACQGDPLWMCGGITRLQVFGPPPSSPAVGINVISTCEPWCVTADVHTANPKWGLCVETAPSVTNWDIQCQCPPGQTGPACDQACPEWTYGIACRRKCTCFQNNTEICDAGSGSCECKPGYYGGQCQSQCPDGTFGENCAGICNCSSSSVCDHATGTCSCKPGWNGKTCNFPCQQGYWGLNCNSPCYCPHGSCAPEDGTCDCDPGYKLPSCAEGCDMFTYGKNCEQFCDCNQQNCDPVTGRCICGNGYIGAKCQMLCPFGTWGQGCSQQCPCHGGSGCDHKTGTCICEPGYIGEHCQDKCLPWSFGIDCQYNCSCITNNTKSCDIVTGKCLCLPGFYGHHCEAMCPRGFFGDMCSELCLCKNGASCDPVTGKCNCAPGFIGTHCDSTCHPGFYGTQCTNRCGSSCSGNTCNIVQGDCSCKVGSNCICPENTFGALSQCNQICGCVNGRCNSSTQGCNCYSGWMGALCDTPCGKGKAGPSCMSICSCAYGDCMANSGICNCQRGFIGSLCDQPCSNNTFGPGCQFPCPKCGMYALAGCDKDTGACLCMDGFFGALCDRPCPVGMYGNNCSHTCSCQNGGACDNEFGQCSCLPGFTGIYCEIPCPRGTWGINCSNLCDCGVHGEGCSPDEGVCLCKPGFTGVKCRQSCAVGTYGVNCSSICTCDTSTSVCSPLDGSCMCNSGYTGPACATVCSYGFWGRDCTQKCQCNNRGTCDPFSGQCDCAPGYYGATCDTQCMQDIYWGRNCVNLCTCNGAHCDHRDGTCRCPPGKIGHSCEQGCDDNHFGFQCAQLCGCQNSAECDHTTGSCRCQPGWSGQFCTNHCPNGYFGVDCASACPDCWNGGSCDSFSGTCVCATTFTGPHCNTTLLTEAHPLTLNGPSDTSRTISFSVGQLSGLIIGFVLLLILLITVTAIVSRKVYIGKFGRTDGAVKFKGEEIEISPELTTTDTSNSAGFDNPVHAYNTYELKQDNKSVTSEATSGVNSEDEEQDNSQYFKDSMS